jgi:hypothetical protein
MPRDAAQQQEVRQRTALYRRVGRFHKLFNQRAWNECYQFLDPRLRENVNISQYAGSLSRFAEHYGEIKIRYRHFSVHLDVTKNKQDPRPFAFVYVFWQDRRHDFHVFRERWVEEAGDWYTRVVGLVIHESPAVEARPD